MRGRPVTLRDLRKMVLQCHQIHIAQRTGDEAWEFIKALPGIEDLQQYILKVQKIPFLDFNFTKVQIQESENDKEMMAKADVIFYLKSFKVVDILEVIDYDSTR